MSTGEQPDRVRVQLDVGEDYVGILTFERGRNNYLNRELVVRLSEGIAELERNGARAIVLTSPSRHFCAGADFGSDEVAEPGAATSPIYEVVPKLFERTVPVVAAVRGAAVGGGLGLALSADFRIATPSTRFLANFARLGTSQGFALSVTLPRLVGVQRASEMLYTGRAVYGAEALQMGLCDRVVDGERLVSEAGALAADIAASAPLAVQAIRQRFHGHLVEEITTALERDWKDQTRLKLTADFREGTSSVRERRPARFSGK